MLGETHITRRAREGERTTEPLNVVGKRLGALPDHPSCLPQFPAKFHSVHIRCARPRIGEATSRPRGRMTESERERRRRWKYDGVGRARGRVITGSVGDARSVRGIDEISSLRGWMILI